MRIIFIILCLVSLGCLCSCAQPPQPPPLEIPGLQQYYQMPGPYYTAPPPQFQYYDPELEKNSVHQ